MATARGGLQITARERFHETMSFGSPDRVPYWEIIGHWGEALERWRDEGMPGDVHVGVFFGLDRRERLRQMAEGG